MALPVVKSALECGDFSVTVEPYLSQFRPLASTLWASLSNLSALGQIYLDTNPLISSFAFSLALAPLFVTLSEINKNYSQVDRVWSILPSVYIIHYAVYAWAAGLDTVRIGAVALASSIWSTRLTYNYWRRGGYEVGSEDYRWYYVKEYVGPAGMFVFNIVFIAFSQSVLLWVITSPAYVILNVQQLSTAGVLPAFTLSDGVAFGAIVGFVALTAVADQQQWNFYKAREEYRQSGKVPAGYERASLERGFNTNGLFAYSRKPNYAFEQGVWASLYAWSCAATGTWYNWSGVGLLSYLSLFQSSTWITELLSERKYAEYKQYRDNDGAMMADDGTEAFPKLSPTTSELKLNSPPTDGTGNNASAANDGVSRTHASSNRRTRAGSIKQTLLNSNPPLGMWQATGEVGSKIPTLPEIRSGAFSDGGWSLEGQMEQRGTSPREIQRRRVARTSTTRGTISHKRPVVEERTSDSSHDAVPAASRADGNVVAVPVAAPKAGASVDSNETAIGPDDTGTYPNGYRFPKKHTWTQSTGIGLKAFSKFVLTPFGFFVTLYGLNVVGWGAMIFFVLLKAAPAMCHPSCDADNSARKIWIEIDSQILNALFCVTAFGLAPWRFRDFYYLMRWRLLHEHDAHRQPPLTGVRAPPSPSWTLDFVIWMYIGNTFLQAGLCGVMWAFNRHNRPSWAVGLLISLGCLTGIFAGILVFIEGSRVKKVEGIPIQEYDVVETVEDYHERKAREDAKLEKKNNHNKQRRIVHSEKVKGHQCGNASNTAQNRLSVHDDDFSPAPVPVPTTGSTHSRCTARRASSIPLRTSRFCSDGWM
ncbi:hypothetical protein DV735_g4315, partial [Chaetothyriales sp. CBS 134920]